MPMENTGKTYGEEEFVLMTAMDSETIQRRINNAIKDIPNAIGIGHAKPKTLNVLSDQIPRLKKMGYKFEFVSNMLH